jgi:hypothetical protein
LEANSRVGLNNANCTCALSDVTSGGIGISESPGTHQASCSCALPVTLTSPSRCAVAGADFGDFDESDIDFDDPAYSFNSARRKRS